MKAALSKLLGQGLEAAKPGQLRKTGLKPHALRLKTVMPA